MAIAAWSGSFLAWEKELSALKARFAPVFRRKELKATASAFIDGLLSGVERKTGWLMAERAGLDRPYQMQSLLGRSHWDADALRDEVRGYVIETLGDTDGILAVDDTGFLKKGTHSVGVARQYSGTAGRIENCQVGVFLGYASRFGQALIDRQLYLPEDWAKDTERRAKAHVPEDVAFHRKTEIARMLIAAALDAGAPCAYVLADAAYGSDSRLRRMLEDRQQAYVLAVRSNQCLRFWGQNGLFQTDPAVLAHALSSDDWTTHAAGEGTKGIRLYEWARVQLPWVCDAQWERWLLIRRRSEKQSGKQHKTNSKALKKNAYYFAFAPLAQHLRNWLALQGCAGPSKNALSGPKMILAWIIARRAHGMDGTVT
jgi:hypothetical protein